jgi:hypothetical protein
MGHRDRFAVRASHAARARRRGDRGVFCCTCSGLQLCRFSAAGDKDLTTRSGGRRLKSAKARNRGGGWNDASAAGYGDLAARGDWRG